MTGVELFAALVIGHAITSDMFTKDYADVFAGDEQWKQLETPEGDTFAWDEDSTYVRKPPYFEGMPDDWREREEPELSSAVPDVAGRAAPEGGA